MQTSPTLPDDHGRTTTCHAEAAQAMRETDNWVLIGNYGTRLSATHIASDIRTGRITAYRGGVYDTRPITTADGTHQVWGRWIGPREARR